MSAKSIMLANDGRLASEQRTRMIGGSAVNVDFQEVAIAHVGSQPLPCQKYFKNLTSVEMRVDGSTPVNFDVTPASAEILRIEKLVLVMVLTASPTMVQFGDQAALGNGISLQLLASDDTVITDLLDGMTVKSNNDLATVGDLSLYEFGASYTLKTEIVPVSPIRLEETSTDAFEKLRLTVADNLAASTITRMRCMAFGRLESTLT